MSFQCCSYLCKPIPMLYQMNSPILVAVKPVATSPLMRKIRNETSFSYFAKMIFLSSKFENSYDLYCHDNLYVDWLRQEHPDSTSVLIAWSIVNKWMLQSLVCLKLVYDQETRGRECGYNAQCYIWKIECLHTEGKMIVCGLCNMLLC